MNKLDRVMLGINEMGENMQCPVCRKTLVVWKNLRLETLGEHVCDPNGEIAEKPALRCPDENCATRKVGCIWDNVEGGLFYEGKFLTTEEKDAVPFIDGISAPFGSFDRGWATAKKAEAKANKKLFTFPKWFPGVLSEMEVHTAWTFQADDQGKITSRHFGLNWLRLDIRGGYRARIYHNWGMSMLIYCIKSNYRLWKNLRKNPKDTYARRDLESNVKQKDWHKPEWWRHCNSAMSAFLLKHAPKV